MGTGCCRRLAFALLSADPSSHRLCLCLAPAVQVKGNVYKNKRVLMEAIHKQKAEKIREKVRGGRTDAGTRRSTLMALLAAGRCGQVPACCVLPRELC